MGGANLEVFKFSLYLFVPIAALVHFGDPDWYRQHVVPVSPMTPGVRLINGLIIRSTATSSFHLPTEPYRIRAERLAKKAARDAEEAGKRN
ncbi:hypothetical protein C0989_007796 [Termitomyces sp. Mn162]|nr:hypothetical protein C0989_007796 [Termitomyces sp. Mn162]